MDDLIISQKKVIVQLSHLLSDWNDDWNVAIHKCIETVKDIPSAEKTGHWNFIGDQMFECSECKHIFTQRQLESWRTYTYESEFPNYCPNCGANLSENPTDSKDVIWHDKRNYSEIVVEI